MKLQMNCQELMVRHYGSVKLYVIKVTTALVSRSILSKVIQGMANVYNLLLRSFKLNTKVPISVSSGVNLIVLLKKLIC